MHFDSEKKHRRSIRLAGYDYRAAGAYFVTIYAAHKRCIFGKIENDVVRLHPYEKVVAECWQALPSHFPHVILDQWIVMPNHFHGIIIFTEPRSFRARLRRALKPVSLEVRRRDR